MSKSVILQKVGLDQNGATVLDMETICQCHEIVKNALGENYIVITSPMDLQAVTGDDKIITIDCKAYSYNELMDTIEKADMYDGLCE